jgi:hypothetical protein
VKLYLHPSTPSWRGAHFKNSGTTLPLPFTCLLHPNYILTFSDASGDTRVSQKVKGFLKKITFIVNVQKQN